MPKSDDWQQETPPLAGVRDHTGRLFPLIPVWRWRESNPRLGGPGGARRGCMTSATASRWTPCWAGTEMASTSAAGSRCSRPTSGTCARGRGQARPVMGATAMPLLAPVLEGYFLERLTQRRASPNTIASYRDTFRLLLGFAQRRTGRAPSGLDMSELDADLIGAFLDHLERDRSNRIVR